MARSSREITVDIPVHVSPLEFTSQEMAVDGTHDHAHSRSAMSVAAHVDSDGLLLYVSQASYEEGSSPLSCWIPNKPVTERLESSSEGDGPLDVFQRCVGPVISRPLLLTVYQPGSTAHSKESWCARLDGHVDTNPRNFIIHDYFHWSLVMQNHCHQS